ncbi:hypothetical protein KL905_001815 [Ogataea polymorpha]|nr:hypothetical protein KL907_001864 [Ogataea polymorpha]KAG7922594.1 hypothetical protein KL905_001815 [Ogataea polymorpha]
MILMLFKLLLFRISLNTSLEQARKQTYSTCSNAETYASSLASVPHYISKSANVMIAKGLSEANKGFMEILDMVLTSSKGLIMFAIEMTIGTYVCVLTATVDATAEVALNATESVISLANDTVKSFAEELQDGLDGVTKVINALVESYEDVKDIFDDDGDSDVSSSMNKVNLTISSLKNWQIPGSINTKLESLSKSLPDFDDVMNYTEGLVSEPFEYMKEKVSMRLDHEFYADELLVPDKKTMAFCAGSGIDEFYEDLADLLRKASNIIFIVLVFAALGFIAFEIFMEKKQWDRLRDIGSNFHQIEATAATKHKDELAAELVDMSRNRYSFLIGQKLGKLFFGPSVTRLNTVRWVVNYISSDRMLPVLLLALAGIATFILQLVLLDLLSRKDATALDSSFKSIGLQIRSSVNNSLVEWANDTNLYISDQEASINDDVLGWIHNSTGSLNATLGDFVDEMNGKISDVFGNTPLYPYVSGIVGCTVTHKIQKVEKALSWIHNHSQVTLPRIDPADFDLTDSKDSGSVDQYLNDTKSTLATTRDKLVEKYKSSLRIELYISMVLLGVWLLFFVAALFMAWLLPSKKDTPESVSTFETEQTWQNTEQSESSLAVPEKLKFRDVDPESHKFFAGPGNINQTLQQLLMRLRDNGKRESASSLDSFETVVTFQPNYGLRHVGDSSTSFADPTMDTARRWTP